MKFFELFAGAGGLSMGLERAGHTCVGHAEIEPHARAVLRHQWPDCPLYGDVTALTGQQLVAEVGAFDLLSGGSPCQDLSVAGKRAGLARPAHGPRHPRGRHRLRAVRQRPVSALRQRCGLPAHRVDRATAGDDHRQGGDRMRRGPDDAQLDPRLRPRAPDALGPLFEPVVPRARVADPPTSHAAAASMLEAADVQRAILVNLLRAHGPMTADELDDVAGWRPTTAGRRLVELERTGRVERTEATRLTRSGRQALVWRAK